MERRISIKLKNKYKGICCCLEDNHEGVWAFDKEQQSSLWWGPSCVNHILPSCIRDSPHPGSHVLDPKRPQHPANHKSTPEGKSRDIPGTHLFPGEYLPLVKEKVLGHLRQILPKSLAATYNLSQEGGDWPNSCSLTCFCEVWSPQVSLPQCPFP